MEQGVPISVSVAAVGLVAIGLFIGFVAGLITGWVAHDRK